MKINVYTIDIQLPRWLKQAVIFGAIPVAVLLGTVHYLRADVTIPNTFTDGDTLSAAKLNANFAAVQAAVNASAVPPGTVVAFAGATAPSGWLLCDGSAVSRSQYAALFGAISVTYGLGDAVSTFDLPDLRAAGIRGVGTSAKYHANVTVTRGQVIDDQLQGHYHRNAVATGQPIQFGGGEMGSVMDLNGLLADGGRVTSPTTDGTNGQPRTGPETTGKAIGMNYIIKY